MTTSSSSHPTVPDLDIATQNPMDSHNTIEESQRQKRKTDQVRNLVEGLSQGGTPREEKKTKVSAAPALVSDDEDEAQEIPEQDKTEDLVFDDQTPANAVMVLLQSRTPAPVRQPLTLDDDYYECYAGCFVIRKQVRDFSPHFQKHHPDM